MASHISQILGWPGFCQPLDGTPCYAHLPVLSFRGFQPYVTNRVTRTVPAYSILVLVHWFYWSGRRDSNSRPPAPKTVFSRLPILPVFNYLRFKQLRPSCCGEWNGLEPGGSRQLHFYLQCRKMMDAGAQEANPAWLAILTTGTRSFIN